MGKRHAVESRPSHFNEREGRLVQLDSIGLPRGTEPHLLEAIAFATYHGSWGDVCFLVESQGGDCAYACVHASLLLLRVSGAVKLVEFVKENGHATLEAALKLLHRKEAYHEPRAGSTEDKEAHQSSLNTLGSRSYVPVSKIAATTLRAVIMYVQTGHIAFAPRSDRGPSVDPASCDADEEGAGSDFSLSVTMAPGNTAAWLTVMQASPRSIYMAARRFGLATLQRMADEAMEARISPANVLDDLFSRFTLKYDEIRAKRFDYLVAHYDEVKRLNEGSLANKLLDYADRPGAKAVVEAILSRACFQSGSHD